MKKYFLLLCCFSMLLQASSLEALLEKVQRDAKQELAKEDERLKRFEQNKNAQARLLKEAKTKEKNLERLSQKLNKDIDANEIAIAKLEKALEEKTGDLGEMFGLLRQVSADFSNSIEHSNSSAYLEDRSAFLEDLTSKTSLPNMQNLSKFWYVMLEEIYESGRVKSFDGTFINHEGKRQNARITSFGQFGGIADKNYLLYDADAKSFVAYKLPWQESETINAYSQTNSLNTIVLDPSRGTLVQMLQSTPTLKQRVQMGGVVGYVIITLGSVGLLFALYKVISLNILARRIKKQMKQLERPMVDNPLGRIADVFYKHMKESTQNLEIKLDAVVLKELADIKSGQSFIKLLAAVAPLLGLLGTVTGMITTFQAITLFGTGDPKLMAGGISAALITTVLGLVCAIPLLFAHTFVASKSTTLCALLEEQSVGMLANSLKQEDA